MKSKAKTYLFDTGKVFLITLLVILLNVNFGWVLINKWFSFYLAVFFFLFIPFWLIAFGIVFQRKWTWYAMMTGSFFAVFLLSVLFFASSEDLNFRLGNSLLFAAVGGLLTVWGWLIRHSSQIVWQQITKSQQTKKERDSQNRPTPFDM
jgi:hypothetical protein